MGHDGLPGGVATGAGAKYSTLSASAQHGLPLAIFCLFDIAGRIARRSARKKCAHLPAFRS